MMWQLKTSVAARLSPVEQRDALRAVNTLTTMDVRTPGWEHRLKIQRDLCDLVPGPTEPANAEPL